MAKRDLNRNEVAKLLGTERTAIDKLIAEKKLCVVDGNSDQITRSSLNQLIKDVKVIVSEAKSAKSQSA